MVSLGRNQEPDEADATRGCVITSNSQTVGREFTNLKQ
jgi:hypothetical protein